MTKYLVSVTALAVVYQQIEVEAKDEEAAEKKALKIAKGDVGYADSGSGWELNGLFDDGKTDHCKLEVTEVEEVEEEALDRLTKEP